MESYLVTNIKLQQLKEQYEELKKKNDELDEKFFNMVVDAIIRGYSDIIKKLDFSTEGSVFDINYKNGLYLYTAIFYREYTIAFILLNKGASTKYIEPLFDRFLVKCLYLLLKIIRIKTIA